MMRATGRSGRTSALCAYMSGQRHAALNNEWMTVKGGNHRPGIRDRPSAGKCDRCARDDSQELHRQPQPGLGSPAAGQRALRVCRQGQGGRGKEDGLCRLQGQTRVLGNGPGQGPQDRTRAVGGQERQADRLVCRQAVGRRHRRRQESALADLEKHYPGAQRLRGRRASSSGRARRTPATPVTPPATRRTSCISSRRCARNSTLPTRSSCSPRWANPSKAAAATAARFSTPISPWTAPRGKYPEFKGNVATIYTNPMAQGGSGNGHYGGKAEVYMDVGEAMGKAMVELLKK